MQAVAGRQVVVDWAVAKARFTDAAAQSAPGGPCCLCIHASMPPA